MSFRYSPPGAPGHNLEMAPYGNQARYGYAPDQSDGDAGAVPWGRYLEALKRHALLIFAIAGVGIAAGFVAAKRVQPTYDVQSTVWIAAPSTNQTGPIRPQQLLPATSWIELLRSYSIIEPVVRRLRLNISTRQPADSIFFTQFESLPALRPGAYVLRTDSLRHYFLSGIKGPVLERGTVGDSIGRKLGFGWAPDARLLKPRMSLTFWVSTPRNTSMALLSSLRAAMPDDGQFLTVTLSGSNPDRAARTLNAWVEQFVVSSGDLKKRNLLEFKKILGDQLSVAESQLRSSEVQLEKFRVSTITLPSGGGAGTGAGQGADQSVAGYFQQKSALDELDGQRVALEQLLTSARGGPLNPSAFMMLPPAILANAPQLRAAIDELSSRQATLRTERQFLTDANPRIKQLTETVRVLQYETLPQILQNILEALRVRERNVNSHVDFQSVALRTIPARMIEEQRLARQVAASENLYSVLKARYEEVSLAEAQTSPDLRVLDYAVATSYPNSNDAPRLLLLAILASIGFATAIALLHDRVDRRFRYPDQATRDLGLAIVGTVPHLKPKRSGEFQLDLMSQVVESFRTLRLAIRYEYPTNSPVVLAVSSPSSNDGKSLVSSNLALAFASAGHRTLLIDGDVRRGTLHTTFPTKVTPGLVEYLSDGVGVGEVVRPTSTDNLFLLPRGTRATRAPELLVSDRMGALIQLARESFEVVIIDCPPFVAGVDAYALAAAAGSILVVLRQGTSDRKLAAAKLEIADRLPIRFLGAVINGVPSGGLYRYYGTDYSQDSALTRPFDGLAGPRGLVVGA
jgi:succinoglycan biosynthesis transport protein ExoP